MQKIRRFIPVILLIMLVVSAAANWALFSAAQKYYYDLQNTRFSPLGLNAYHDEPSPKSGLPRVVFYGDSRAFQWPAPNNDQFEFFNRGIGSQTSNQILLRYDEHIAPLKPDILIVQMCINELKTVPIFPNRRKQILNSCQQNTKKLIGYAAESDTTIILTTIFPVGPVPLQRRPFWSADVAQAVDEINTFLAKQASESDHVILFDSYGLLADGTGGLDSAYAFDELHLNEAGYNHLNQGLIDILDRLIDNHS